MSNTTDILQHHLNKFGVVTVMDVILHDKSEEKKPLLVLDTLKITSLDQEGQQKEIRGGIGAPELMSYDFARTISVEIQDALASMASLKTLWGGRYLENSVDYTAVFEEIFDGDSIAIPDGIDAASDLTGSMAINLTSDSAYTVTQSEEKLVLTVTEGKEPAKGDVIKVFLAATAKASDDVMALAINSIDLPPTVHLTGKTFFIDQRTGKKIEAEIEIPLFKVNLGGGLSMEAEGDAAVFDFSGKALQDPITKNFFVLKQLGEQKD